MQAFVSKEALCNFCATNPDSNDPFFWRRGGRRRTDDDRQGRTDDDKQGNNNRGHHKRNDNISYAEAICKCCKLGVYTESPTASPTPLITESPTSTPGYSMTESPTTSSSGGGLIPPLFHGYLESRNKTCLYYFRY